jgi:hypothetical protein
MAGGPCTMTISPNTAGRVARLAGIAALLFTLIPAPLFAQNREEAARRAEEQRRQESQRKAQEEASRRAQEEQARQRQAEQQRQTQSQAGQQKQSMQQKIAPAVEGSPRQASAGSRRAAREPPTDAVSRTSCRPARLRRHPRRVACAVGVYVKRFPDRRSRRPIRG